jgi:phosphomannomutase
MLVDELQAEYGPFFYDRIDRRVQTFDKKTLVRQLKDAAPAELGGQAIARINDRDGVKYLLADDSWLLIRPSGTEPVLRIYAEARSPEMVKQLLDQGVQLAQQFI